MFKLQRFDGRDKARPAKVASWRPDTRRAYSRSADAVRAEYMAWAAARGLERVTVYEGDKTIIERLAVAAAASVASKVYGDVRMAEQSAHELADSIEAARARAYAQWGPLLDNATEVDPAEFLGPAPKAETWED